MTRDEMMYQLREYPWAAQIDTLRDGTRLALNTGRLSAADAREAQHVLKNRWGWRGGFTLILDFDAPQEPTLAERYAAMSDEEQARADVRWCEMGGDVSEEKVARMRRYGLVK